MSLRQAELNQSITLKCPLYVWIMSISSFVLNSLFRLTVSKSPHEVTIMVKAFPWHDAIMSYHDLCIHINRHQCPHYSDVIMSAIVFQVTGELSVYSTVCSGASKKTSKPRITGLCTGNLPVTGEFPAQRASDAENASIWWRHHDKR